MLRRSDFELDVAMVDAVDADDARLGVPHAVQQRQRRALAGAGRADEGHRRAGRHLQREMHQRRPLAVIGEVDVVELDVAPGAADVLAVRLVGHGRLVIEDAEEIGQRRHLEEDAADEARGLVHAADQHGGEAHEAHDLADRRLALGVEPGAEHEDQDHGDGRGGARQHRQQRPPVQHRILRRQRLADDAVHLAGFGAPAARSSGSGGCCPARRRRGWRARCDSSSTCACSRSVLLTTKALATAKNRISTTSSRPSRQFMNRLSGSMMNSATKVARFSRKKRQPDAEQVVDAGQHDLDQPAGMLGVVEGERQHQHVLEEVSPWRPAAGDGPCGRPAARRRCWRRCRRCRPPPTAPAAAGRRATGSRSVLSLALDRRSTTWPNSTGS